MQIEPWLQEIVEELQQVAGIRAVVLGGSRARGTHDASSDVDLGIYYHPEHPLDLEALDQAAARLDDRRQTGLITPMGEWGPWINGGGWLSVRSHPVDFLYRDLTKVREVIAACLGGVVEVFYQPGHPHAFTSAMYLAEIAVCQPLWDPDGLLAGLKKQVLPYPEALQRAELARFGWEIDFSIAIARKSAGRAEVAYVAGCCFRSLMCMLHVLFALNREFWLNEKGALQMAARFAIKPERFQERAEEALGLLEADPGSLDRALEVLAGLSRDIAHIVGEAKTAQPRH